MKTVTLNQLSPEQLTKLIVDVETCQAILQQLNERLATEENNDFKSSVRTAQP